MTSNPTIAVALALCSVVAYAFSAALQRRETARASEPVETSGGWRFFRALLARRWWWGGIACMVAGAIIHVGALGFGSITLVQPIGVTTLILALPLDSWLEKRRISSREWVGAVVLVAGLVGLLTLAAHGPPTRTPPAPVVLGAVAVIMIAAVVLAAAGAKGRPVVRAVIRAAASGLCAGATSGLVRLIIQLIADDRSWVLVGVVVAAALVLPVASILLIQTAFRDGGLDAGLATQITADQIAAAAIGIVVLGERYTLGAAGAALAAVFAVVALVGLVVLIRAGPTPEQRRGLAAPTAAPAPPR
ncbi:DMT family transporter [Actinomycetospora straminea]|uniref:DMT family transporter n=1 Tax=Actinomycetospora straminea TaxID=663607 RepID=A0ABP9E8C6_9PSEU|nr:DMT family transporter [Actinomycetospora straminea]MDD7935296.1 DMT family transporter [Actinomycetospora straminea]